MGEYLNVEKSSCLAECPSGQTANNATSECECGADTVMDLTMTACVEKYDVPDCTLVAAAWKLMGRSENLDKSYDSKFCCGQYGITCDDNGKVTAIKWTSQDLIGHIPPTLGYLTELKQLYFPTQS